MPEFSERLRALFLGNPFGEVFPPRPAPPPTPLDGRTVALRLLFDYISELTFYRSAGPNVGPIAFKIKRTEMYSETPTVEMQFPSIGVIPGEGFYDVIGLNGYVEESTRDQFGHGTVIQWASEYRESFQLEVHCGGRAERRAIISGLESALWPTEQMYGVRFVMPDYYYEPVIFVLGSRVLDDSDAVRGRRRVRIKMEMRHNVVALINYELMQPDIAVGVTDPGVSPDIVADPSQDVSGPVDKY